MGSAEEENLVDHLRNVARSRRAHIEKELHRIEEYVVGRLEKRGLKVKRKGRTVPVSSGPRLGLIAGGAESPHASVALAKWDLVKDRARPCKFTYDLPELRDIAWQILNDKRAAKDDIFAATVALQLEDLWSAFHLANAESLELTTALIGITSQLPSPDGAARLISELRKEMRAKQMEGLNKLRDFVREQAKKEWAQDATQRISELAKYFHGIEIPDDFGVKDKPLLTWYRKVIKELAPPEVRKPGRPRK